uniref:Retrovirus-related Pol polyprotein from transposon TNT 1-94 n=1 Tax=Tanacetum cinerariifolium TaxID=118510 RepID=A0A6L2K850_TANCI|nr:hypothetical protein [Tanacetum cinerariifolium]
MDSGASFHATYCKEKLERFKLHSGKDVRYISGLKRRLISVGQLNEEDYHHQRLGDMSRIGMNILASKGNVLDVQKKAMALHLLHQYEDPATMILLSKTAAGVALGTKIHQRVQGSGKFGVAERLSHTFRAESMGPCAEAPKILWNDSIVAEHGLSSKITQSAGESLVTSEGPKTVGASRIVEDHMKNTLKMEHPLRKEASRFYRYEDPPESPGLW